MVFRSVVVRGRGFLLLCVVVCPGLLATDPLHVRIDRLVSARPGFDAWVSPPASDAEFLRRVHLDLTGSIPEPSEVRRFLSDSEPAKRRELVDRLLAAPEHARHMARVFDHLLMQRRRHRQVTARDWRGYLQRSFADRKPWDALVREILAADGTPEKNRAAAAFYLDRGAEASEIVRTISAVLLGRNLQCAQCHDHPTIDDYEQSHFFGLAAYVDRSYLFKLSKEKSILAEKAEGVTSFASALSGKDGVALPRVFDGPVLVEPELDKEQAYVVAPADGVRPIPQFSRRDQLAAALIEHPAFRTNIANRLWALVMGRGIVEPVDLHYADNPPSHPELLELLAESFKQMDYHVDSFLRELVLTQTYARSSRSRPDVEAPPPESFAVAALRPLSADQLAWSLMRATGQLAAETLAAKSEPDSDDGEDSTSRLDKQAASVAKIFVTSLPGQEERGEPTPDQALFLLNSPEVLGWLVPRPGNLVNRLGGFEASDEVAEELFVSVLSRFPQAEEVRWVEDHLRDSTTKRDALLADLVWALTTGSEFRFNH